MYLRYFDFNNVGVLHDCTVSDTFICMFLVSPGELRVIHTNTHKKINQPKSQRNHALSEI